jgi:hypothetical protein
MPKLMRCSPLNPSLYKLYDFLSKSKGAHGGLEGAHGGQCIQRWHRVIRRLFRASDSGSGHPTGVPGIRRGFRASYGGSGHPTGVPGILRGCRASDGGSGHPTVAPGILRRYRAVLRWLRATSTRTSVPVDLVEWPR